MKSPGFVIVLVFAALLAASSVVVSASPLLHPNILLIVTDDEDLAVHSAMPRTKALLEAEGTTFDNFFVTSPFCSPSRATILRGQYPHNHNVQGNVPPTGGYEKFSALGLQASTVATWLDAAGYRSAIIGKYLNGYEPATHSPAMGWHEWFIAEGKYYNFRANWNGTVVQYGSTYSEYQADVVTRRALSVVEDAAADKVPFFLLLTPYGIHAPATPSPRYARGDEAAILDPVVSFDEADVTDKPSIIRALPTIEPAKLAAIQAYHQKRTRALRAVDDMVALLARTLAETGQLSRTFIVYTSDNGFHMGEHRIVRQKNTPYEESIRVPMIVRGPGVPAGKRVAALVINNDIAPSVAAMAGVEPPSFVDGRSFLPLLHRPDMPWRQSFLIERRETERHEMTDAAVFDGIRTKHWTYVEYGNGERELYDLERDPFQLDNRIGKVAPALVTALSSRLAELKNCAAEDCRVAEDLHVGESEPQLNSPE